MTDTISKDEKRELNRTESKMVQRQTSLTQIIRNNKRQMITAACVRTYKYMCSHTRVGLSRSARKKKQTHHPTHTYTHFWFSSPLLYTPTHTQTAAGLPFIFAERGNSWWRPQLLLAAICKNTQSQSSHQSILQLRQDSSVSDRRERVTAEREGDGERETEG